jgi:hypothetical protein
MWCEAAADCPWRCCIGKLETNAPAGVLRRNGNSNASGGDRAFRRRSAKWPGRSKHEAGRDGAAVTELEVAASCFVDEVMQLPPVTASGKVWRRAPMAMRDTAPITKMWRDLWHSCHTYRRGSCFDTDRPLGRTYLYLLGGATRSTRRSCGKAYLPRRAPLAQLL